jgi:amidohydrolase
MIHEDIKNQIKEITKSIFKDVITMRRHIHQNPELSFQEKETSKYICSILDKHDISYERDVAGFGVVGLIKSNNPDSQVIAIRADMDALPIKEQNKVDYKSINDGVMHACGHDVHSAILLGVAIVLNKIKDQLSGTVKLIFQPAEEMLPGGASLMIKEGVLKNPDVDKIFALHVFPEFQVGNVGFRSGKYMAACDELHITINGKGGHAALPKSVINPITIASELLLKLKSEVSIIASDQKYILEFGDFHAYGASNVIPDKAHFKGTLRTLDENFRSDAHKLLLRLANEIEAKYLCTCDFELKKGYPVLYNDPSLTSQSKELAQDFLGNLCVQDLDLRMSSEDFSYFSQKCPSCFFRIGVGNDKKNINHLVHNPQFNVDEKSLEIGVGLMSFLVSSNLLALKKA